MAFALTPAAIAAAAAAELPRIFGDALDTLRAGEAQYLRDGVPNSIPGAIAQAAGRSACRIYGTGEIDLPPAAAEKYERACRPYLDDIAPPDGPTIKTPFQGGQCEDGYRFLLRADGIPGIPSSEVQSLGWYRGPITGFTVSVGDVRTLGFVTANSGPVQFGSQVPSPQGLQSRQVFDVPTVDREEFVGSIVGSFSPQPDGCGNPAPVVRQPGPISDPTPPPFRFNPGPFIDVDVDVDVLPDGTINVNVGGPTFNVDPFSDGGGDDGGGGSPPPPPGDIGDPGGSGDTGSGGEVEGEAGSGDVLVGLKIDVLASPPNARQYAPGVFRGAGYIYMGVAGNLDQDYGGSMLKSGQFFFAEKDNLTHWDVSANNGYNFRVTPYYREAPE